MEQLNSILMQLYSLGDIHTISVERIPNPKGIGELGDVIVAVTFQGEKGVLNKVEWNTYKHYLEINVNWLGIAKIKQQYLQRIHAWNEFEKENAKELQEYRRLQAKFGAIE